MLYLCQEKLKPEEQLGKIEIVSDDGLQYLYNVDKVDESMSTLEYLDNIIVTAKGPHIADDTYVDMRYDLFNGAFKGNIRLDVDPLNSCVDDGIEEVVISSEDETGMILVRIGRYFHATVANLEVRLLSADGSTFQNVSGVISATNSRYDYVYSASVLFAKKHDQGINVQPDGVIPLVKTHIAVPLDTKLHVDVCLNVNGVDVCRTETFDVIEGVFSNTTTSQTTNYPKIKVTVKGSDDEELLISTYDTVRMID